MLDYSDVVTDKFSFLWWKDLVGLTSSRTVKCNWFTMVVLCKLGNSSTIRFWKHNWLDHNLLATHFNNLFGFVVNPNILIRDIGYWLREVWN